MNTPASPARAFQPFDLLEELPTGTTVLEASAGTGKTYAIGALVTRYVAEGTARLEEMLVLTFGRAATRELRDRVRDQLVEAERALADPAAARARGGLAGHLASLPDPDTVRRRVADAVASYDAATIATIHQFCHVVLRSLGVAGDTDSGHELVEDLAPLVTEVVDDRYLARFAGEPQPPFSRAVALQIGLAAVGDPQSRRVATDDSPVAQQRLEFADDVVAEVERRKRRHGILSYDDLLGRLRDDLRHDDSPARQRMRSRWRVVLVDEFQDTDPVQWEVLHTAFGGHTTMVLVGDPKQAVYAFRGGDVHSYLDARDEAGSIRTLTTNWRSDAPLVDALQVLTRDVALGDPRIVVHDVTAHHGDSRLAGAPRADAVRLRRVDGESLGTNADGEVGIGRLRRHIAADLAADVAALLDSGATYEGRPVQAADVAILMSSVRPTQVQPFRDELSGLGIPSVITSGSSLLLSQAAAEWQCLLEAMEQPSNVRRIRAVGLTAFGGLAPEDLDEGADGAHGADNEATDRLADQVRGWLELFRSRGIAAVHESVVAAGLDARVLAFTDGARLLTDLDHLAQVLHDRMRRERLGLPALLAWLRAERVAAGRGDERTRRLDTDAAAVQILTIHGSKGLQYPLVYLPTSFDRWVPETGTSVRFHDDTGHRCLDVGGNPAAETLRRSREEDADEELRLCYVAMTRAEAQLVCWWAPSRGARAAGLTRLLLGRSAGEADVPRSVALPSADTVDERLSAWAAAGAFALEDAVPVRAAPRPAGPAARLAVRRFDRTIDEGWRRTSYSGLVRVEEQAAALGGESEPEVEGTVDEVEPEGASSLPDTAPVRLDLPSPMAELPAGAAFGSLVHAVLEHADPQADDLAAELLATVGEQQRWWGAPVPAEQLAIALEPMHTTSLGPLADGLRLVDVGRHDRLCELDFEMPLDGGDARPSPPDVPLSGLADLLRRHLPDSDPVRPYADRLETPGLGGQSLRGYLSGSLDLVLRVPDDAVPGGWRYLVADYKTNLLGDRDRPLTAGDYRPGALAAAMLHSHYPLQAMLYTVVLHRFLRWRLPGYRPGQHLGGVLYLYVRGMCGPETPEIDGNPCGVFSWRPPGTLVEAISRMLDGLPAEEAR
ncbi:MAG: UvrD-helicase domain-containing protein [Marmoricola sp.]